MKNQKIIQGLLQDSIELAHAKKYVFSGLTLVQLKLMIRNGIKSLSKADIESDIVRTLLKLNIEKFISAMLTDSKRRFMTKRLEHRSFVNAQFDIKVLWPFY